MEPFKVHILGCGSALPTLRHNPSSQVVEIRGKFFMVDCGEGTQTQLRHSKIKFTKINAVFISHAHGDHCFGLIGMISTFGMLGRTAPLHVYAPAGLREIMKKQMEYFCNGFEYEVIFHDVDTSANKIIYEDRSLSVETVPLSHRMPCSGYIFREKPTLPHILRDMADYYNVPVSQFNNIKNGADWIDNEGNIIAIATSRWLLMDIVRRRPCRLTEDITKRYECEAGKIAVSDDIEKIILPQDIDFTDCNDKDNDKTCGKMSETNDNSKLLKEKYDIIKIPYRVLKRDIDFNGHVHNLVYLDMALEALPDNINNMEYSSIRIEYKKEIMPDSNVLCTYCRYGNSDIVVISTDNVINCIVQFS